MILFFITFQKKVMKLNPACGGNKAFNIEFFYSNFYTS